MAGKRAAATTETNSSEDFSVELDKKKAVTVRKFNGTNLVDIREFYIDKSSGERKPGKKGIALTEESWAKLLELLQEINDALDTLNGGKRRKTDEKSEETSPVQPENASSSEAKKEETKVDP